MCGWLPYYRPFRFASQSFDWLADSSVFSRNSILHRIKYSFFFFVNMTKIDLEECTKKERIMLKTE